MMSAWIRPRTPAGSARKPARSVRSVLAESVNLRLENQLILSRGSIAKNAKMVTHPKKIERKGSSTEGVKRTAKRMRFGWWGTGVRTARSGRLAASNEMRLPKSVKRALTSLIVLF